MAKIARSFRLEDIVDDRLNRLVAFYNLQPSHDNLPGKNKVVNRTDILEFLISSKFEELIIKGNEL
jgi:hypothetical protein